MSNETQLTDHEIEIKKRLIDLENQDKKSDQQRAMAWIAIGSVVVLTIILMTPVVSDTRLELLGDIVQMFYITQAGIVAAFFGAQAFMTRS